MTQKQKDLIECLDTLFEIARLGIANFSMDDKIKQRVNKRLSDARRLILTGIEKGDRRENAHKN